MTERCFGKIDSILKAHIKHNQSKVISKEELKSLCDHVTTLESIQLELTNVPETSKAFKEHLEVVKGKLFSLSRIVYISTLFLISPF